MRAMVQQGHGEGQLLPEDRQPTPLGPEGVRINVEYCGLNHLDLWLKRGDTGDKIELPRVPGSDVLGRVVEVGKDIAGLAVGDRVIVYPGRSCDSCYECTRGRQSACRYFGVLGYAYDGGYTQQLIINRRDAVHTPLDAECRWAAVPVSYITAWNGLITKCRLTAGETVVIWGASGGLGNAALKISAHSGARVIAIVTSPEKADRVAADGFDGNIIVRSENIVKDVRRATGGRGADVVLDHVGAATWMTSLKMLAATGRLSFCGVTTGHQAETDLRFIFGKQISIHGTWIGDRQDFHDVAAFLRNHTDALPTIDKVFPLKEAQAAQDYLESGTHSGKVLLEM